ncbi:hypothetical protein ILUMI_17939 [Ignelater luminosus]|uniref:Uncharacterized protein n=1 Tax=Ignelater luminosus TaxID=2038154 RepID=A0A8K0CJ00_IGNLU|nr:hypothetical protein ILUMI_17939 [Ignelater luminosus]
MNPRISRLTAFNIWNKNIKNTKSDGIFAYVLQDLRDLTLPNDVLKDIKITLRSLCQKIQQRWEKSGRHTERFLKSNSSWLQQYIQFSIFVIQALPGPSQSVASGRPGRPKKTFEDCCFDRGLAIMVDANLSTCQYNVIRQQVMDINPKLHPAYHLVKKAKMARYPKGITMTEVGAETELQSLVNHTVRRLCVVQEDVLRTLTLLQ